MANRDLHPRGRNPKRVLAVRMLAAKIAWLDAPLLWSNGRVCWKTQDGLFTPAPADLARAQNTLYKINQYPIAAELAFQDREAWTAERTARLEHAKLLCGLQTPDLATLFARPANAGDPRAVDRLVRLLIAESLCLNNLPVSPAKTLVAWGQVVEPALQRFIAEGEAPLEARALAALALAALHDNRNAPSRPAETSAGNERIRRAYGWGRRAGIPSAPGLSLVLLADAAGEELAQRFEQANSNQKHLAFPMETLREMLFQGATPTQIVELAEALVEAEPLVQRILAYQHRLDREARRLPEARRQEILAPLQAVYAAYAQRTLNTRSVPLITRFITELFKHFRPEAVSNVLLHPPNKLQCEHLDRSNVVDVLLRPLTDGLELPSPLLLGYLELLSERCNTLWPPEEVPKKRDPWDREIAALRWLLDQWKSYSKRICAVLRGSQDAAIVREAMDLGLLQYLRVYAWEEPGMYRYAVSCLRVHPGRWRGIEQRLCSTIDLLGSAAQARSALQPLLASLRSIPAPLQESLLHAFLHQVPHTRAALSTTLPQLARYAPLIDWYTTRERSHAVDAEYLVVALLALHTKLGEETESWFRTLLTCLLDLEREGAELIREWSVGGAALLAVTLAEGDQIHFQRIFRALVRRSIEQNIQRLERGIEALAKHPILLHPLSVIFPQQPERCTLLLMRVGLATRLGTEALTPLAALNPENWEDAAEEQAAPVEGEWGELLALLPEFAAQVAGFRQAQKLLSRSDTMPAGVHRALELPRRMARELAFLERSTNDASPDPALEVRAARLRQSLARPEEIAEAVRADVGKRLDQITALAQIDAAEQQVLVCYRNRLESVAGPLPPDLVFDVDLQNATLLTADIEKNRRLLQRLLRAHIEARPRWREAHPANAAFLQQLAARGVDAGAWLGAHPRRYSCLHAAGKRVRLHLEQNPLRILQMGNYFDTCLSFGGINAFSTVANACELNKRVVYAADGVGRIVGRKLIGISAEGRLIGFRTYTSLTDEEGNRELIAIFRRYLRLFAERCGLELANEETVPTLFAEAWYDDGSVDWEKEEPPSHSHSSPHLSAEAYQMSLST